MDPDTIGRETELADTSEVLTRYQREASALRRIPFSIAILTVLVSVTGSAFAVLEDRVEYVPILLLVVSLGVVLSGFAYLVERSLEYRSWRVANHRVASAVLDTTAKVAQAKDRIQIEPEDLDVLRTLPQWRWFSLEVESETDPHDGSTSWVPRTEDRLYVVSSARVPDQVFTRLIDALEKKEQPNLAATFQETFDFRTRADRLIEVAYSSVSASLDRRWINSPQTVAD